MKDSKEIKDEELEKVNGGYSNGNNSYPHNVGDCYLSSDGIRICVITNSSLYIVFDVYYRNNSTGAYDRSDNEERTRDDTFEGWIFSRGYTYIGKKDECGYVLNY